MLEQVGLAKDADGFDPLNIGQWPSSSFAHRAHSLRVRSTHIALTHAHFRVYTGMLAMKGHTPLSVPCTPRACMELLARYNIDIDGTLPLAPSLFLRRSAALVLTRQYTHVLCAPLGLRKGKRAVVLGRSNIVGTPVALMLLHKYAALLS